MRTVPGMSPASTENPSPTEINFRTGVVLVGNALDRLKELPDNSVDSIVCDPPYGLSDLTPAQKKAVLLAWLTDDTAAMPAGKGFMGKGWGAFVPPPALWAECLRVLKPGGHLAAFAGSRTVGWMSTSIELAGFDIRDGLMWVYGSGFPKSLNVGKAIDKAAGATREVLGAAAGAATQNTSSLGKFAPTYDVTEPATDAAKQWDGWGTALKPAHEPIVLARKPLAGTVAANVLAWGTGALNIDASRVGTSGARNNGRRAQGEYDNSAQKFGDFGATERTDYGKGRWPANLLLTHDARCGGVCVAGCPVAVLDQQSGVRTSGLMLAGQQTRGYDGPSMGKFNPSVVANTTYGDSGGASRFFTQAGWEPDLDGDAGFLYCAKPGKKERNAGLDHLEGGNSHPTCKPASVMGWLIRLLAPPGGVVLDPFLGSGTTAVAAVREGFRFIGVEMTPEYIPILEGRIHHAEANRGGKQLSLPLDGGGAS